MSKQHSSANGLRSDPQLILQNQAHTIAGVFRTPGASKYQTLSVTNAQAQRGDHPAHLLRSRNPACRLLTDLAKSVIVPQYLLLSGRSPQQLRRFRLTVSQVSQPL